MGMETKLKKVLERLDLRHAILTAKIDECDSIACYLRNYGLDFPSDWFQSRSGDYMTKRAELEKVFKTFREEGIEH